MNEIEKINFHGNEIITVDKNGNKYVAMKPIVEAMGLDWSNQLKLINNDPVLSSTMAVTAIVAEDGKKREMVCLPLEYLNGWLFKVPASRYKGKRREAVELYQRECYRVLYEYWHTGAAISPSITKEQLSLLVTRIEEEIRLRIEAENKIELLEQQMGKLAFLSIPKRRFGEISPKTGLPMDKLIPTHIRSDRRSHEPQIGKYIQLLLPLYVSRELLEKTQIRLPE